MIPLRNAGIELEVMASLQARIAADVTSCLLHQHNFIKLQITRPLSLTKRSNFDTSSLPNQLQIYLSKLTKARIFTLQNYQIRKSSNFDTWTHTSVKWAIINQGKERWESQMIKRKLTRVGRSRRPSPRTRASWATPRRWSRPAGWLPWQLMRLWFGERIEGFEDGRIGLGLEWEVEGRKMVIGSYCEKQTQ